MLRIYVNSGDGDKVKINMPLPFIKACVEIGMDIGSASGSSALKGVDMSKVIEMAEKGMIGKIVEVESCEGDTVEIVIE